MFSIKHILFHTSNCFHRKSDKIFQNPHKYLQLGQDIPNGRQQYMVGGYALTFTIFCSLCIYICCLNFFSFLLKFDSDFENERFFSKWRDIIRFVCGAKFHFIVAKRCGRMNAACGKLQLLRFL